MVFDKMTSLDTEFDYLKIKELESAIRKPDRSSEKKLN